MASKFQSRLVGTVIIVAIGVIVLPDVFDGQKQHYKEEFAAIPIKPTATVTELDEQGAETEQFEIQQPVAVKQDLPQDPVIVTIDDDNKQVVKVEEKPVREKNQYNDSAWIIQVSAVRNKDNANNLVLDLQKRGFQAHLQSSNDLYRVIVGPDVSKAKLEQQAKELEKIMGANVQLQTFKPLNP